MYAIYSSNGATINYITNGPGTSKIVVTTNYTLPASNNRMLIQGKRITMCGPSLVPADPGHEISMSVHLSETACRTK